MKSVIGVLILAGVVSGVYFLNDYTRTEGGKSLLNVAGELEIEIETAQPEQRDIIRTVQAPGEVEASEEVDISSEVVGKIVELPVEEGDAVKRGDLLCRLDDADFRARVVSAEANVARLKAAIKQSEAGLQSAELDWARLQRLRETQATSEQELAYARAALIGARAAVEMAEQQLVEAEAALQYARDDLAKTVIETPIDGVVSQLFAEQGEVVITGTMNNPGTRIMVISDLSKMQVRCRVDESDVPLVAPGQVARIYLQSDTRRSVPGEVLRVATKGTKLLGRDVVTFETLVLVGSDEARVRPGMTANLEIEVARREQALVIPVQGVVYRKRRDLPDELVKEYERQQAELEHAARQHLAEYVKIVFCVEGEKARARLVQTGVNDVTGVEIIEGLTLDDAVVIGPYRSLDQLQDGSLVKPLEEKTADESEAGDDQQVAEQQGEESATDGDS